MSRGDRLVYWVLMGLGIGSLGAVASWWVRPGHLPENFTGPLHGVDVVIFALLTLVVSHRVFMDLYAWVVARKIRRIQEPPLPPFGLRVAFITTFVPGAEGLDLLRSTLPAMVAADYPHDVWLLDEGDDADARQLCADLGVSYFTRKDRREYNLVGGPFTRRTKGGNHNAWYDEHGHAYDVVAQIDTDFTPRRDFLTATLGYFADPAVGWVGTPQIYGNTDSFVTRGAAQQQYTFYGPVLRGLDGRGMANMLGANHVVRVRALEEIDFYAGHLTEDLLTGMRLHARGWRSHYVPLPLAVGEGPDTWKAYFNQQQRWAYGCIDILRHHSSRLVRSMPRSWRLLYLSLQQGYFSGVAGALGVALLAAYFLGGVQISRVPLLELLLWSAPFVVVRQVIRLWLQKFSVRPKEERGLHLTGSLIAVAVWPIYFMAFVKVWRGQHLGFKVTPKGAVRPSVGGRRMFLPHLTVGVICGACLVVSALTDRRAEVLVAWAAVNVVLMTGFFLVAGRAPSGRRRPAVAAPHPVLSSAEPERAVG